MNPHIRLPFQVRQISPHQLGTKSRVLACDGDMDIMAASFGPQGPGKTIFENIFGIAFLDNGPSDPKLVPWDQNFGLKFFLIQ